MPHLFEELKIRGVQFRNRIAVSPMCEYSCSEGMANEWHFVHLGSRAVGGAGIVFTEGTAVLPDGRISPQDLGIWSDLHAEALAPIVDFIHQQGCRAGIQLAHAGRKASTRRPWDRNGRAKLSVGEGGWHNVVAPSAVGFADDYPFPREITREEISGVAGAFAAAARRALDAGFDVIEIHGAHGYLIHEFYSPLSNFRTDEYGGSFENRTRLAREVISAIRHDWPEHLPLFMRISASDWTEGGWDVEQSIDLARAAKSLGLDLMDCSSGGNVSGAKIPFGPGFQVPFAERIRKKAEILTGAVGMITEPAQADEIIRAGKADIVLLAREMLRNPYWPLRAARDLGQIVTWPPQYLRAAPEGSPERISVGPSSAERGNLAGEFRGH